MDGTSATTSDSQMDTSTTASDSQRADSVKAKATSSSSQDCEYKTFTVIVHPGKLGLDFDSVDEEGATIKSVKASLSSLSKVKEGDKVIAINHFPVSSREDLKYDSDLIRLFQISRGKKKLEPAIGTTKKAKLKEGDKTGDDAGGKTNKANMKEVDKTDDDAGRK